MASNDHGISRPTVTKGMGSRTIIESSSAANAGGETTEREPSGDGILPSARGPGRGRRSIKDDTSGGTLVISPGTLGEPQTANVKPTQPHPRKRKNLRRRKAESAKSLRRRLSDSI
jgi:hypothetical protein